MKKTVKMALYAEPGVGKSTFASKAPNVFFITTDGNFQWLNLPDNQHVEVSNWNQMLQVIEWFTTQPEMFEWCETVVVDLLEDTYKLCEDDFCVRNKIQYIGDLDYGKGYAIVKNEFTIAMSKLISIPKNIIFLLHGYDDTSTKDARGNTRTKHVVSNRIPDKVLDVIEGKLRYFLRAYLKTEINQDDPNDPRQIKKRYISLVPKANEYGIARGLDEANCPQDIELDWDTFAEVIGLNEGDHKETGTNPLQALLNAVKPSTSTRRVAPSASAQATTPSAPSGLPQATIRPTKPVTPTKATEVKKEEPKKEDVKKVVEEKKEEKPTLSNLSKEEVAKAIAEKDVTKPIVEVAEKPETVFVQPKVEEQPKAVEQPKKVTPANANDVSAKLAALKAAKLNKK